MLKDKPELLIAHAGQFIARKVRNFLRLQKVTPATRTIKATKQIHEGGFTRAGRTHHRNKFALIYFKVNPTQRLYCGVAHDVVLGQAAYANQYISHRK